MNRRLRLPLLVSAVLVTCAWFLLVLPSSQGVIDDYDEAAGGAAEHFRPVVSRPVPNTGNTGNTGHTGNTGKNGNSSNKGKQSEAEVVVARTKSEDTSWVAKYLPDWERNIYIVDDPSAELTVPMNKGRETMVYLTFMIDRYDSLPPITIFLHAQRFQWHNDDPDYDGVPPLRNLNLTTVRRAGYANLRCVWVIGCPAEIRPHEDAAAAAAGKDHSPSKAAEVYKEAFEDIFPGETVPDVVAVSCCGQFAVTRETIRARPKADYVRFRQWLLKTPLPDDKSGVVLEYMWHIIFGKPAVHCPSARQCYCDLYGLCDLTCDADGSCKDRYTLPPYSTLPQGWPLVGWQGETRPFEGPL